MDQTLILIIKTWGKRFLKLKMTKVRRGKKNKNTNELTFNDERISKKDHVQMSSFLRVIATCREHS